MSGKFMLPRLAVQLIGTVGVTKIANDIIAKHVVIQSTADVVKTWVGSIVIGSMVAEHTSNHLSEKVDAVIEWHENRKMKQTVV